MSNLHLKFGNLEKNEKKRSRLDPLILFILNLPQGTRAYIRAQTSKVQKKASIPNDGD
jgi:hypothetical protein